MIRLKLYRILTCGIWRLVFRRRLTSTRVRRLEPVSTSGPSLTEEVIWFHGASAGELESILSLVERMVEELDAREDSTRIVLTAFSPSAERLLSQYSGSPERFAFVGLCPPEGKWAEAFERFRPRRFVTARYEAWPELWVALSASHSELMIVGAADRSSIRWAKRICAALGEPLPLMLLLAASIEDQEPLKRLFPRARVSWLGDPRWDRVNARLLAPSPRAQELGSELKSLAQNWMVLAQVWPTDLEKLPLKFLKKKGSPLLVVPHSLEKKGLLTLDRQLTAAGYCPVTTSSKGWREGLDAGSSSDPFCILVDEIGVLAELYPLSEKVYIGGGFGAGIHSVLEPAFSTVPIACGPTKTESFPEVDRLKSVGMLTVVRSKKEAEGWIKRSGHESNRAKWKAWVGEQLGATSRMMELFDWSPARAGRTNPRRP